jgi:hypothetical protein
LLRRNPHNLSLIKGLFSDRSVPIDIELLISGAARYLDKGTPLAAMRTGDVSVGHGRLATVVSAPLTPPSVAAGGTHQP